LSRIALWASRVWICARFFAKLVPTLAIALYAAAKTSKGGMTMMESAIPSLALWGLSVEMTMLILGIALGFVQLQLAAGTMTAARGAKWNMGPRDEPGAPLPAGAGRLDRAYKNFMETFPYFAAAVLASAVTGRHGTYTAMGAEIYVAARILYVPLYAFGVSGLRTIAWLASVIGIILMLVGVATPGA
jgi:uncharacterized MAPEG superfamily protein